MVDKYKKLKIPRDEKLFILPEARQKLFMHMINEYKKRCPNMKLIYAYLNFDEHFPVDYILMFSAKADTGSKDLIVFDIPYLYSDRTTPGYRYCIRENLLDDFFEESTNQMPCLTRSRFNEYVNIMLNMSTKKGDEKFWKNPENAIEFGRGLVDLAARYTRRNN